jgi:hypothetical protein
MAGRPVKRQREREASLAAQQAAGRARPRAKNADVATRRTTVERAAKIGDAAAAAEVGVSSATVRSWRRRLKAEAANPAAVTTQSVDMSSAPVDGDAIAQMRNTAGLARDLAEEAARQSQQAMRVGDAIKVRELSASAKMWAATAASLEQAGAVAASAEIRLTEAQAHLMAALVKNYHAAVGVPMTPGSRKVLRALLEAGVDGADLNSPDVEQAAREIRTHFRQALAAEVAAEIAAESPPSEDEPDTEAVVAEADNADVAIEKVDSTPVSPAHGLRPEPYVVPRKSSRPGAFTYPGNA